MNENNVGIEKALQHAKAAIEAHYADKFTYALPDWAMLTGNPEFVTIIKVHGLAGISICKQRVAFPVSFSDIASISRYADFLNQQMDKSLAIVAFVVFYNKQIKVAKDPQYTVSLTTEEESALNQYNEKQTAVEISLITLNSDFEPIGSLDEVEH